MLHLVRVSELCQDYGWAGLFGSPHPPTSALFHYYCARPGVITTRDGFAGLL